MPNPKGETSFLWVWQLRSPSRNTDTLLEPLSPASSIRPWCRDLMMASRSIQPSNKRHDVSDLQRKGRSHCTLLALHRTASTPRLLSGLAFRDRMRVNYPGYRQNSVTPSVCRSYVTDVRKEVLRTNLRNSETKFSNSASFAKNQGTATVLVSAKIRRIFNHVKTKCI